MGQEYVYVLEVEKEDFRVRIKLNGDEVYPTGFPSGSSATAAQAQTKVTDKIKKGKNTVAVKGEPTGANPDLIVRVYKGHHGEQNPKTIFELRSKKPVGATKTFSVK